MPELDTLLLTLDDGTNQLEYEITVMDSAENSQTKDAFSIAPPGLAPAQNILMGVSGMEADLTIQWAIHDDGEDKSNGTAAETEFYSDEVVTLAEQKRWLEDYIHAPDFTASWTLEHTTGEMIPETEVFLESLNIPFLQQGSPRWLEARMDLRKGGSI